jgi:hypothetical protein
VRPHRRSSPRARGQDPVPVPTSASSGPPALSLNVSRIRRMAGWRPVPAISGLCSIQRRCATRRSTSKSAGASRRRLAQAAAGVSRRDGVRRAKTRRGSRHRESSARRVRSG